MKYPYRYTGFHSETTLPQRGIIMASSKQEALTFLQQDHIQPLICRRLWCVFFRSYTISRATLVAFWTTFHHLLTAGFKTQEVLHVIAKTTEFPLFASLLRDLRQRITQGMSLSQACGVYPHVFDALTLALLAIAEHTGSLEKVTYDLAERLQTQTRFQRRIMTSLIYPAFVLGFLSTLGVFFAGYIGPELQEITQTSSPSVMPFTWCVLGCMLATLTLFSWRNRHTHLRYWPRLFIYHLPLLGKVVRFQAYEKFFYALFLLFHSQSTVSQALRMAEPTIECPLLRSTLQQVKLLIEQGQFFSQSLSVLQPALPPLFTPILQASEASGQLREAFQRLALLSRENAQNSLEIMLHLLTPLVVSVLGLLLLGAAFYWLFPLYQWLQGAPQL